MTKYKPKLKSLIQELNRLRLRSVIVFTLLFITSLSYSQQNTLNIGVLLETSNSGLDSALLKLQNQIQEVAGSTTTINFPSNLRLANNFDLESARNNYQQLLNGSADLILAFGQFNQLVIANQESYPKPTIMIGSINQELSTYDPESETSNIENFTYFVTSQSYRDDLVKLRELSSCESVGLLIEEQLAELPLIQNTFQNISNDLGISLNFIPFNDISGIEPKLENVDAVYLVGGFFLSDAEVSELADMLLTKKLPSFTNNGINQVELGIMATNQSSENIDLLMRRISLTVDRYLSGSSLADVPVHVDFDSSLTVNYNTAEFVGIPLAYSLLAQTSFVGEFKNVLSEKDYNLVEAIAQVLEKNLSLTTDRKEIMLSEQDVSVAKSNYLPSLTAAGSANYNDPDFAGVSLGQSPEFQTAGNVTLDQLVYSAGASANVYIQKQLLKAQEENYNASQLDAVFNIANAYFNALILKTSAEIQINNLGVTKKNLDIANQNFEGGAAGKSDVLRFRSQMAQNTQSVIQASNQLQQVFIQLNQLLNNPADMEIDIQDVSLGEGIFEQYDYEILMQLLDNPESREVFVDFLVQEAMTNSPELKSIGYNLNAIDKNIELNGKGRYLPTVGFQGQYNYVFDRSGEGATPPPGFSNVDGYYTLGLNLSIPIFNQNLNNINKQTALIEKEQLSYVRNNSELAIEVNVRNTVYELINQITNIELSKVSQQTAEEALDLTQTAYRQGAVSIIQLIDAQNNFLTAQSAYANAIYSYLLSSLQLERSMGYFFLLHSAEENSQFIQRFNQFRLTDK